MSIFDWFRTPKLVVDYRELPKLPRDAQRVHRHQPLDDDNNQLTLSPKNLMLREMPRGYTYEQYRLDHQIEGLCDARVLDAFGEAITAGGKISTKPLKRFFGDFQGQVFFLGTSFMSSDGRECVSFLNVGLDTTSIRNMCPVSHPVNHDVVCCACYLVEA